MLLQRGCDGLHRSCGSSRAANHASLTVHCSIYRRTGRTQLTMPNQSINPLRTRVRGRVPAVRMARRSNISPPFPTCRAWVGGLRASMGGSDDTARITCTQFNRAMHASLLQEFRTPGWLSPLLTASRPCIDTLIIVELASQQSNHTAAWPIRHRIGR